MKISDSAQAAARLAVVNDKVQLALQDQLRKWFSAQFVKGMKLQLLRAIFQAGSYPAFSQLLLEASDSDRSVILTKLDKYRDHFQMRPKAEIMAHIEALASGRTQPAAKPAVAKDPKPTKTTGSKAPQKKVGIISGSKY